MSTINLDVMNGHRQRVWRQVQHGFAEWRRRARSRGELMSLSDRTLQDIGISRCTARFEACKPFWMP